MTDEMQWEPGPVCPACGEAPDYCQGHGEIGDPVGHHILTGHDMGLHGACHPLSDCHADA